MILKKKSSEKPLLLLEHDETLELPSQHFEEDKQNVSWGFVLCFLNQKVILKQHVSTQTHTTTIPACGFMHPIVKHMHSAHIADSCVMFYSWLQRDIHTWAMSYHTSL